MSQKRKRAPSPPTSPPTSSNSSGPREQIYRSAPLTDRSSTFQALFSPSLAPKTLQSHASISTASHKILATRRPSNQQAITGSKRYITTHDDDGETHAGKTVAGVLAAEGVEGSCVVARWYGGVMLGPVRFTHMEECAREAIAAWRKEEKERLRVEEEERERDGLVRGLRERDGSIEVLRGLASQKELAVKAAKGEENGEGNEGAVKAPPVTPTAMKVDYEALPLERLRALDKARDKTVAFLLKRIDNAEIELLRIATSEGSDDGSTEDVSQEKAQVVDEKDQAQDEMN